MFQKIIPLLVILVSFLLFAGCVQSDLHEGGNSSTAVEGQSPVPQNDSVHSDPVSPSGTTFPSNVTEVTALPTLITPLPTPEPTLTPSPKITQDPLVEFRDRTLLSLDDMNSAKEGLLLSYKTEDMGRVKAKSEEFSQLIRKYGQITNMPAKMDYVRLNYYEYIDQASQVAQTFTDGSTRWLASDKSSANSLFDAGVMASDRADISDKRIRKFFDEHVFPVQMNPT